MSNVGRAPSRYSGVRDGVRLSCVDHGGDGTPVVLLHGVAGNAREWDETASWLIESHRVLAFDARGHGESERRPDDVSRAAHVDDVVFWLNELGLAPAHLVGQSLGGHTAFLVGSSYPGIVRSLVVAESTPALDPDVREIVGNWLESWPVPFGSQDEALAYFGGDTLWARGWTSGLQVSSDGLRPRFDVDVVVASLRELATTSFWSEWGNVKVPAMILRAENGVPLTDVTRMAQMQPCVTTVEISGAGHDVHLDKPAEWREALASFLSSH